MSNYLIRTTVSLVIISLLTLSASAQKASHAQLGAEIAALREQITEREAAFLAPDAEDLAKFAVYHESSDGGLVRILPREKYGNALVVRGGGSFYSFATRTHEYGWGNDLCLEQGKFSVGFAGADLGFLKPLGDIALETVTLESGSVQALAAYVPPANEPLARLEWSKFHQTVVTGGDLFTSDHVLPGDAERLRLEWSKANQALAKAGDAFYLHRVPAVVGQSYAVRSIVYGRTDILAAFRVVRKDDDGSLILIWKMLQRYPTPQLKPSERPVTVKESK